MLLLLANGHALVLHVLLLDLVDGAGELVGRQLVELLVLSLDLGESLPPRVVHFFQLFVVQLSGLHHVTAASRVVRSPGRGSRRARGGDRFGFTLQPLHHGVRDLDDIWGVLVDDGHPPSAS
uniref:Putative secreted protein n=1 Tax=Ixodes ricinus TaxID=34613 RepID=A0A6B0UN41_IXORI